MLSMLGEDKSLRSGLSELLQCNSMLQIINQKITIHINDKNKNELQTLD